MIVRKLPAVCLAAVMALACTAAGAQQASAPGADSNQVPTAPPTTAEAKAFISDRFKAADANHDGKLSRDEAKAGMPQVYKNFSKIDSLKRGYVTERQIGAYWEAKTKEQMQKENPIWN